MANAKKCDRCGEFYIEVEPNAIESLCKAISDFAAYVATPANVQKQIYAIQGLLDLCPDCLKSLRRWARCKEDEEDGK